jgi:hypothetical protein
MAWCIFKHRDDFTLTFTSPIVSYFSDNAPQAYSSPQNVCVIIPLISSLVNVTCVLFSWRGLKYTLSLGECLFRGGSTNPINLWSGDRVR